MLRHLLKDLELVLIVAIVTLIFWIVITLVTVSPIMAKTLKSDFISRITETEITPEITHCRAEQSLIDESGHKWGLMLFTNGTKPSQFDNLQLRLSGLSSSLRIQSQKPLVISFFTDDAVQHQTKLNHFEIPNNLKDSSPLPNIGQYDLHKVITKIPRTELVLEIPLEKGKIARLHVPETTLEEWQEVVAKPVLPRPRLPSNFQLFCINN